MNYQELKAVAEKRIEADFNTFPVNARDVAQYLDVVVKNSLQCRIDYKTTDNPLLNSEAIYCLFKGEYTIYYDENHPYKNFFIAHEIAHHLLDHQTDDINKHHDANLLGAIIVAPPRLIANNGIKSAAELAEKCRIPIEVASEYWNEIKGEINSLTIFCSRYKYCIFASILAFMSAVISFAVGLITADVVNTNTD